MLKILRNTLIKHYLALNPPAELESLKQRVHIDTPLIFVLPRQSIFLETLLQAMLKKCSLPEAEPLESNTQPTAGHSYFIGFNAHANMEALVERLRSEKEEESHDLEIRVFGILRDRGPIRSNPRYMLSWLASLYLLITPFLKLRRPVIVLSAPFTLQSGAIRTLKRLQAICRSLYMREVKAVRGIPFEIPERVVLHSVGNAINSDELESLADELGYSHAKTLRLVKQEVRKIAARPRAWAYIPAAFLADLLVKRLFTKVQTEGLDTVREVSKEATPVIVPLHRSHLDYVVISLAMYQGNLLPPLIAAGVNLNFWPFGTIARSLGGFFVKRKSHDAPIHRFALEKYLHYIIGRGHSLKFYIEGGRSRSGKMRAPRLGILSAIIDAYRNNPAKDIVIIPTTVSYERVIEDSSLAAENAGVAKTRENIFSLLQARKFLKQSYGEVEVRFGEPLSFKKYFDLHKAMNNEQVRLKLGRDIIHSIRDGTLLTHASLESTAILSSPYYGLKANELHECMRTLALVANTIGKRSDLTIQMSDTLERFIHKQDTQISSAVRRTEFMDDSLLYIPGRQRFQAEFYKNSTIHIFIHLSLLAIEELHKGTFSSSDAQTLYPFLQYDMQLPPLEDFLYDSERALQALLQTQLIERSNLHFKFVDQRPGLFNPLLVAPQLEAFYLILTIMSRLALKDSELIFTELQAEFLHLAKFGKYLGVIQRTETGSQSTFEVLLPSLEQMGIVRREFVRGKSQKIILLRNGLEEKKILLQRLSALATFISNRRVEAYTQMNHYE